MVEDEAGRDRHGFDGGRREAALQDGGDRGVRVGGGLNWIAVGAIAGPVIAALALWLGTREKKVDALAEATRAGFEGMVSLTDNQRDELERYRQELVLARAALEACERSRVVDRKSLDDALVLVGELKAKVEYLEKLVGQ